MKNLLQDPDFPVLIRAYRSSLVRRYSSSNLERYPEFNSIPRSTIDTLLDYFLILLYPEFEGRVVLDGAFQSLSGFVHSPAKVFGLIGSLGAAAFSFGKHLGAAFKTGFAALHSYLTARRFETLMFDFAKKELEKGNDPADPNVFRSIIAQVPKKEADQFRIDLVKLFETLSDRDLLEKIVVMMRAIVRKMESKPKTYTKEEVEGIRLGLSILEKGRELFEGLSENEMKLILKAVDRIETDFFEDALKRNGKI
ncbi:hypothetical protein EHQ12_00910 [Leptospira gomenensis]|uniref:Uncharacterized protein n=1 Tax=Leptospira gomenensis TaxID=2484974 RepID=A0A5F1Z135_9LEPT|nr:hypothetical protein [Leptospira gomenensis]TGK29021.1 hypothetical protein EHQ17_16835 [Leptospira gomenensis]TGK44988.1 hypothetical protein EHQ12_00910 [Leptospira gomenensis]TGK51875.1 hypothetical protein EHQ07_01695 [Leptospira gomenensis]TGK67317.1 hypothetical protein EHQ13_02375 [Leptospira gomenensis]